MILLLLAACGSPAQDTDATVEALDVSAARDQHGVPALAAATVDGGGLTAIGAAGVRVDGEDDAVTTGDAFHLGSDTKAMTATLAAILVEEGVLSWDLTLAEAFPDVDVHVDLAEVTLEDLLTHSSGLTGSIAGDHPDLWQGLWDRTDAPAARVWLAEQLLVRPPDGRRGVYLYSNAAFTLAGAAMEAVTGESWEDLLADRVLEPLGMDGCGFGAPRGTQPWGHRIYGEDLFPITPEAIGSDNPVGISPAGAVHCPLADWGAFIALHLRGGRGEDTEILPAASFDRLHTPRLSDVAMGWFVTERPWAEGPVLNHAGSNTLWYAVAWLDPEGDAAYLGVSNVAGTRGPAATDAAIGGLLSD